MNRLRVLICTTLIAFSWAEYHGLYAQEPDGSEFAAAVNLTESNAKVDGVLFIPREVQRVAAVFVILDYGELSRPLLFTMKSA